MQLKVTTKVIDLVEKLFAAGYTGNATLTDNYPTGAEKELGGVLSVQLTGFSKEHLYIVEDTDTGGIVLVGRYNREDYGPDISVETIVELAYRFYQHYKARGFTLPSEFQTPFVNFGYIKKVVKTIEEWKET